MFSNNEKKWIVQQFGRTPSPTKVRRAFLREFKINGSAKNKYQLNKFTRVRDLFEESGTIHKQKRAAIKPKRTEEVVEEVRRFMAENSSSSLRKACQNISPTKTTMWRILRHDLHLRFYHHTTVQPLTEAHKVQRRNFCQWILEQPANIVERIVWTDEKFFCLHQKPHRKNDGEWASSNPHNIIETNDRNDVKVLFFVALVKGKNPIVYPFLDSNGNVMSVNRDSYLSLLKDIVWPKLRPYATRSSLWWMQDGAPPHCTNEALEFLNEKFQGRVISRRTEYPWPAHSPDLNPLDFHFWAAAQADVYTQKPNSLESLVNCVTRFTERFSQEVIEKISHNVLRRATLCLREEGGHFQHLL